MKNIYILLILFLLFIDNNLLLATTIINDGQSHTFNTLFSGNLSLDADNDIISGTHVNLIDGGKVTGSIRINHHASLNVDGGTVNYGGFHAYDNSIVTIKDGLIKGYGNAFGNSTVTILGGDIYHLAFQEDSSSSIYGGTTESVSSLGNSTVSVYGGTIDDYFRVAGNGVIYLYGTDFEVNGQQLSYGDRLSDFVPITEWLETHHQRTGIISGMLEDGTVISNTFRITYENSNYEVAADIIIVPEPASIALLGLGGVFLKRKFR